ncbi:AraC family transcriptional regulator [Pseudomonas sp. NPDC089534]|uniref:AraC family transcriptional regulator n=1 Tax=Pseudomonas sp. NPDC089534 TaxID=3364468 RepID=UPI00382CE6B2
MDSRLLSERSSVFHHADPYAVSDYVNRHVGQHLIGLAKTAHPQASLNHRKFAELDLCRISYGGSVRVTSLALETVYHLQVLLQGNCLWRGHKREQHLVPGELLLINPDDPVDLTYSDDCEKFILKVPVSVLESVCDEQRWLRPSGGIRFRRNHYRLDDLEGFTSLLGMICQEAETSDPLLRVQEHYVQIIGSKLLSLLDTNVSRESLSAPSASLERILDFIERNLKQDLSAESLAAQARMSPRSLYALFERQLGVTPMQHIRQRKLARIHACLTDPSCPVRNLTELALDYGFLHLGRFSESYRQQFGELPSHTFKRRH